MNLIKLKTMKNIIKRTIYQCFVPALLFMLVLVSCDNYLDIEPKGVQLLTKTEDYDQWLNSTEIQYSLPIELNYLVDNVDNLYISNPPESTTERIYTWQEQFSEELTAFPVIWVRHYNSIYHFNTVLQGIDDATGTEDEKNSLRAEALLGRAFDYLYLVNLYGKVYDANTANEDLAVPFVTSNDLNDPTPNRSTVQDIYDHIVEDITTAISDLPEDNSENRFRGTVAGAYSVLARAYLYMGDYAKAAQNAQLALDNGPNEVLDYSTMANSRDITNLKRRTDIIYARFSVSLSNRYTPTLAFLQSFDTKDVRLQFYYRGLGDYSFTTRGQIQYWTTGVSFGKAHVNWGTSVAEMRLILAEAAARSNDLETACDELDSLRKKRFPKFVIDNTVTPPDTTFRYQKFESTNQEEVLQKVLDERTFEFPYNGMRWFDMRRLDAEDRMSAVNRLDASGNVIFTLSPGSNKYTLQIPKQVLYFNPDWEQNPTDK